MIKFLITNNQVISFEDFHYSFNFDRIVHSGSISDEKLVLQCKGMPFILYLYQTETDFALSNDQNTIADYLKEKGIPVTEKKALPFDGVYIHLYEEIKPIADWKTITVDRKKGTLSIEETDWLYYTTPIESSEAYHLIHEWFEQWLDLLQQDELVFDITAGLDSKITLCFLSKRKNWDTALYWCHPYKFNLNVNVEHKELDGRVTPISDKFKVLKELGDYGIDGLGITYANMCSEKLRLEKGISGYTRVKGLFASQLLTKNKDYSIFFNKENFKYMVAYLGLIFSEEKRTKSKSAIPHIDQTILRLNPSKAIKLLSTIILLLYCDFRFLKFPIKSFSYQPTYTIFKLPLKEAGEIIGNWKKNNLLTEEEATRFEKTMEGIYALKNEVCSSNL